MEEAINSFLGAISNVTTMLRDFITSLSADYMTIILLVLSLGAGYWIHTKYPNGVGKMVFILYGIIIFLMLRFI